MSKERDAVPLIEMTLIESTRARPGECQDISNYKLATQMKTMCVHTNTNTHALIHVPSSWLAKENKGRDHAATRSLHHRLHERKHAHTHTHKHARSHSLTLSLSHDTHTQTPTHAHTHAHTHAPIHNLSL